MRGRADDGATRRKHPHKGSWMPSPREYRRPWATTRWSGFEGATPPVLPLLRSARACFTQFPTTDCAASRSRPTWEIGLPSSSTSRIAPALNSPVKLCRARRVRAPAAVQPILSIFYLASPRSDQPPVGHCSLSAAAERQYYLADKTMFQLTPEGLTESRQGYLFAYAQIVFNQARRFIVLTGDPPEYEGWMKWTQSFQIDAERLECRILAAVSAALFLEAYIYDYGARRSSATFVDKYLDKLDAVAKWVLIPRLIVPPGINQDDEVFARLRKLFKLRNDLVHHKTKAGGHVDSPPEFPSDLEPHHCVKLIQDTLLKLRAADPEDKFAEFVLRHIDSWIAYTSKDSRFYPILWEA